MTPRYSSDTHRADERAVSEILGAILMFGLLLALLVLIQVTAVPTWNQQLEFSHSERVQDDMGALGNSIDHVQTRESVGSASLDLGVRYPARPFLINPSPAEGGLQTVPIGDVTIEGARSTGEVGDYWDGSPVTHGTQAVTYSPNYKEFRDAPVTITYEHGTVASSYAHSATVVSQSRPVVSETTINLVALTGSVDRSGVDRRTVPVTPMSRSPRTIAVTGDGGDITISLSTTLPEETWTDLLAAELDGGNVEAIAYSNSTTPATVTLTLDGSVTYDLRTALVGVGDSPQQTQPAYLERIQGGGAVVPLGSSEQLTVEVRDQFNAPKSGVDVTYAVVSGGGEFRDGTPGDDTYTVTSNSNGQTSAVFTPLSGAEIVIEATATLNDESGTQEEEVVRFTVTNADGTGDDDIINPKDPLSVTLDSVDRSGGTVTMTFENLADSSRQWTDIRIPFISKQSGQPLPSAVDITPENRDTIPFTLGEDFAAISPTPLTFDEAGTADAVRTVTLVFGSGQQLQPGDFFVVTVLDQNSKATTYFVGVRG